MGCLLLTSFTLLVSKIHLSILIIFEGLLVKILMVALCIPQNNTTDTTIISTVLHQTSSNPPTNTHILVSHFCEPSFSYDDFGHLLIPYVCL